jgi:hypothetical protein
MQEQSDTEQMRAGFSLDHRANSTKKDAQH